MSSPVANKLSITEPSGSYNRRYSGAVLFDTQRNVILQGRDQNPNIINAGKLTLFGGGQDKHETPIACIVRELAEELGLKVGAGELHLLGYIDKAETDGTTTRCSIFKLERISPTSLRLREGRAIIVRPAESFLSDPLVSDVSKASIQEALSRT